jgi:YesN/AraC family two-component response regulator
MLWLISEIFTEHYNVIPIDDTDMFFDVLNQVRPNLIISDIMMPKTDGITLTKMIKSDKKTSHIPLILLSAKNSPEEQVEGINAGAEFYLTKPFNIEYLKSIVERLMHRQDDLKEYYSSPLSAYELNGGQLIHKEDKAFFEKVLRVIDKNTSDPAFTSEKLASDLGISSRHLYRKVKLISGQSTSDLIKEYRLKLVENLLISTNLTIEEIMHKTGFTHRASFYRSFAQKHGVTPKEYRQLKKKELE